MFCFLDSADSTAIWDVVYTKSSEVVTVSSSGQLKVWDLRQAGDKPAMTMLLYVFKQQRFRQVFSRQDLTRISARSWLNPARSCDLTKTRPRSWEDLAKMFNLGYCTVVISVQREKQQLFIYYTGKILICSTIIILQSDHAI